MIKSYIQKGEAILVYTDVPYGERIISVQKSFDSHTDVVVFSEEKMKIDTVRDFAYEMQKESTGGLLDVRKIGILICDDIALPAQHALLKVLEDLDSCVCIVIYTHSQSVYMSTVLSRVIVVHEKNTQSPARVISEKYNTVGKTVAEKFEMIKKIMKGYDDEKVTKQDIIMFVENFKEQDLKKDGHIEIYARVLSMLKQPSVSIKYVLEYLFAVV